MKCANCNCPLVPRDLFCPRCGLDPRSTVDSKIKQAPESICQNCSTPRNGGHLFCSLCGSKFPAELTPVVVSPAEPPPTITAPQEPAATTQVPLAPPPEANLSSTRIKKPLAPPPPLTKENKKLLFGLILGGVLFCIVVGVIVTMSQPSYSNSQSSSSNLGSATSASAPVYSSPAPVAGATSDLPPSPGGAPGTQATSSDATPGPAPGMVSPGTAPGIDVPQNQTPAYQAPQPTQEQYQVDQNIQRVYVSCSQAYEDCRVGKMSPFGPTHSPASCADLLRKGAAYMRKWDTLGSPGSVVQCETEAQSLENKALELETN